MLETLRTLDVAAIENAIDDDGEVRETKIWLCVLDDVGYIRTSRSSRWGSNVERDPEIALRVGDAEYSLRATFVEDASQRARVVAGVPGRGFGRPAGEVLAATQAVHPVATGGEDLRREDRLVAEREAVT